MLLDIAIDPDTDRYAWTGTLGLADRFRLTLYDASYLELAQRRSLPLASLDMELCAMRPERWASSWPRSRGDRHREPSYRLGRAMPG